MDSTAPTDVTLEQVMTALVELQAEVHQLRASDRQPLVDVQGVADYLQVSARTVRRMVAAKELAVTRVGRHLRFDLAQFRRR